MIVLFYIIKLILTSSLLYGYYYLFLRNKQFHRYNRFYLLSAALLSIVVPFIRIPLHLFTAGADGTSIIKTLRVIAVDRWEEPVIVYANRNTWAHWFTLQNGLIFLYAAVAITCIFILCRSLLYIIALKNKYNCESFENIRFYNTNETGTPFSFFRTIFWNKRIPFDTKQGQQIFRHELFHVKQQHSSDILLMELLCSIGWFNPFFHLIKKEIKAIHEFLADEYAISESDRYEYAELLVLHAINQKTKNLPNHFFHNQIKRRIAMITQFKNSRPGGYISKLMILPLFFVMFCAFAVKLTGKPILKQLMNAHNSPITVVIDPGHGGIYSGSNNGNGLLEKDLTLSIAQKIMQLAPTYHVNIILTRNADQTVGDASTLNDDLANRVAIAEKVKADLFLSIHVNTDNLKTTTRTGFEVNISNRKDDAASRQFGSAILAGLKNVYDVDESIKQRNIGIQVLDKNTCPAIILECGFLNNPKDAAFISNKDNQEKVAQNILESIVKYRSSNASTYALLESPNINTDTVPKPGQQLRLLKEKPKTSGAQAVSYISYMSGKGEDSTVETVKDMETRLETKTVKSYTNKVETQVIYVTQDTGKAEPIFTKVEVEADYPGGQAGWKTYLGKNLTYPMAAVEKEIKGTVVVQFIVDKDGNVSDVKAISGPKELQEESIRVVRESGHWTPAIQNGKQVKSYKKQPIIYKLSKG